MAKKEAINSKLVEVEYENDGKKAVLSFVSDETGLLYEVNFNKQRYNQDDNSWFDDEEQAQRVEDWSKEYFDTDFDHLSDKIDIVLPVYVYEKFNSLWESEQIAKFTLDDVDDFFKTKITNIIDNGHAILIRFEHNDEVHESKMTYGKYVESLSKWFPNPQKHEKVMNKFEDKFGIPFAKADTLIGKEITVEIKKAFDKFAYAEIKKLKK